MYISCYQTDATAGNLLWFGEITQQFSIHKTGFGKRMPSSFVEARYNLNSSVVEVLTISYNLNMLINYNDLMKAKCDRGTMRREKETA